MSKLALISGGSAGIGFELARLFAQDGYDLILSGSRSRVFDAAEMFQSSSCSVTAVQSDLSNFDGNENRCL